MTYSSSLADTKSALILDTSVLINLHASGYGERILAALPNDILVSEIVANELEHETSKCKGEHQFIHELIAGRKVSLIALRDCEYEIFEELVSGTPSLDDGEAATIAISSCRNIMPIIDERKGRQLAQTRIPNVQPGWSLDLFRHPQVVTELGGSLSVDALHRALRDGRMRISEQHCDLVVKIIGIQRAIECKSLPDYKVRSKNWNEQTRSSI